MTRRLPPLNALRAFEAAARLRSFTKAAAELHVTQGAISHQVRALEEHIGVPLFRRHNRALQLTAEGQDYWPAIRDALDRLDDATRRLKASEASGLLTVSVLPSFAARWLVPRLGLFRLRHPDIDVRIAAAAELANFVRDEVDVAIRHGHGNYPGLHSIKLLEEDLFPVCSPLLLQGGGAPLQAPADLLHHTLLHDETKAGWRSWLEAAGVTVPATLRGPIFTDSGMTVAATIAGQGVALARSSLAAHDLGQGGLARPFALSLPYDYAYFVVCPLAAADRPKIRAFRDWLVAEVDESAPGAVARLGAA
ncbi:MAG: transcriptional regulator GcvA [Alphaproteobacteria bacterium]|nr:transcriptional regulator GcvA [Alphaproteobacteria bacterium]